MQKLQIPINKYRGTNTTIMKKNINLIVSKTHQNNFILQLEDEDVNDEILSILTALAMIREEEFGTSRFIFLQGIWGDSFDEFTEWVQETIFCLLYVRHNMFFNIQIKKES